MRSAQPTVLVGIVLASVAALALTGCSDSAPQVSTKHFTTYSEAVHSSSAGSIPGILPADATDIRLALRQDGPGGAELTWHSAGGLTASYCAAGAIKRTVEPIPTVGWWPQGTPSTGWDCTRWKAFTKGGVFYAWDDHKN